MASSLPKWVLATLVIVVVVAAASLLTKKTFHVEAVIPAPPETVWAILMDTDRSPEWNPVFVAVDGTYAEGAKVTNTVRFPDGSNVSMAATVKTLVPVRELRQSGGIPGVLTFDHQWLLEPVDGGTKVIQHEVDRGFYVRFWGSDWVEPSYLKASEALRDRVMSMQKKS